MWSTRRKRPRREVETVEFLRVMGRMLQAAGRRVAQADEEELGELFHLEQILDEILLNAVGGLRESGATWQTIGDASGVTRQGAFQRWSPRLAARAANGKARS